MIHLKDIVKGGIKERFAHLRRMGIKTVMITGDNPLTAAAIAAEAGVDDFLAQATPEAKLKLIREYQAGGRLVAMTGDGTNDAPALAQADVAVAMNTGTQPAREAANMIDLDSNPTKLIEIVEIGKQLLMTRGSLTTFSIANDVAKYFRHHPGGVRVDLPGAGRAEPAAAGDAAERDPVGGNFQRADHRRLDPAGAARRAVPARGRGPAFARQSGDLWPGWAGGSVYRHQADRPAAGSPGPGMRRNHGKRKTPPVVVAVVAALACAGHPGLFGSQGFLVAGRSSGSPRLQSSSSSMGWCLCGYAPTRPVCCANRAMVWPRQGERW